MDVCKPKPGKILEKFIYKPLGLTMPQWDDKIRIPDTKQDIIITPLPFWRAWLQFLPYFVGNIVRFKISIIGENSVPKVIDAYYIHEYFGDKHKEYWPIKESTMFAGNRVDGEGSVKYTISLFPSQEGKTFFTANVINTDRWFPACAGLALGAVLTFICTIAAGVVLGFIDIQKFWRIWIP